MKVLDNDTLLKQLNWRYATKKFDNTKKISAADWSTLEAALISTPSSFGLQPWHFVVITSQAIKDKLVPISWGQTQLAEASHVVVFAVKKGIDAAYVQKYVDRIIEVRGTPAEKLEGYKGMMVGSISQKDTAALDMWSAKQAYIALGNLMTSAAMLGIDSCPMEGIEPGKYDQLLGLDKLGFGALMVCPLGYRSPEDASAKYPKVRFKAEDLVTHVD